MGRRGPAPAPTSLKLARGERRPSRVNYEEPDLPALEDVAAPETLTGAGRAEWDRLLPLLTDAGVLTAADRLAFERYCRTVSDLARFEEAARDAGPELAIAKGYQGMVVKLRAQANQLAQQCGLTPSSRQAVKAAKGTGSVKADAASRYLSAIPGGRA